MGVGCKGCVCAWKGGERDVNDGVEVGFWGWRALVMALQRHGFVKSGGVLIMSSSMFDLVGCSLGRAMPTRYTHTQILTVHTIYVADLPITRLLAVQVSMPRRLTSSRSAPQTGVVVAVVKSSSLIRCLRLSIYFALIQPPELPLPACLVALDLAWTLVPGKEHEPCLSGL